MTIGELRVALALSQTLDQLPDHTRVHDEGDAPLLRLESFQNAETEEWSLVLVFDES